MSCRVTRWFLFFRSAWAQDLDIWHRTTAWVLENSLRSICYSVLVRNVPCRYHADSTYHELFGVGRHFVQQQLEERAKSERLWPA